MRMLVLFLATWVQWGALLWAMEPAERKEVPRYAELRVIDAETKQGVPLIELETVNHLRFVTDNAGRIAFCEPGLMGEEIFFSVHGHGYQVPQDGFGIAGVRVTPRAGKVSEIQVQRKNIAQRLCRLTGEGLYRDTKLLGYPQPLADSPHPGRVVGQDSVQAAVYRGKIYWFWGDTNRINYALGLYRTAGATTPLLSMPGKEFPLTAGLPFDYFVDAKTGFARAMMPLAERPEGVVWISALCTVPDAQGDEKLVGHYSRRKGLAEEYEQGLAIFDDERAIFTVAKELPREETWRRPAGHPIQWNVAGKPMLLFGSPTPNVRVPATLASLLDPTQYEALALDADRQPVWQKERPPIDGKSAAEHFHPRVQGDPEKRVKLHSGTVRWNAFRQAWVLIAGEIGGSSSFLGEVWYAESAQPFGPFSPAVKILTHDKQSFYNVCQHDFLDHEGGRFIHFEGTYTNEFSGNPYRTPRYQYNQVLYRLELGKGEGLGLGIRKGER